MTDLMATRVRQALTYLLGLGNEGCVGDIQKATGLAHADPVAQEMRDLGLVERPRRNLYRVTDAGRAFIGK